MKSNTIVWVLTATIVLATIAVTVGTKSSYSQQDRSGKQQNLDFSKYPIADLEAPEPANAAEREQRALKNKRYDKSAMVIKNPDPRDTFSLIYDGEEEPLPIPSMESKLIAIGIILDSKASLSNDKSGVYSEYSFLIQSILKNDKAKKRLVGETITIDRSGGFVRYPSGQKILYLNNWQDLPELNGRYIVFLNKQGDEQNPNYKIITAYQLKENQVTPLDRASSFAQFRGVDETGFIKRVTAQSN